MSLQVVEASLASCQHQMTQSETDKRQMESGLLDLRKQSDESNLKANEIEQQHSRKVTALQEEVANLQTALQESDKHTQVGCAIFADAC